MNEQQTERLLNLMGSIADSLGRLAGEQDGDTAPDWVFPIEQYADFDWAGHGALVLAGDEGGPTLVQWHGKNFKRRSPDNAFDPAIWYSRCTGKDTDGRNEYVRLLTFRKFNEDDIQPLGRKAERIVQAAPKAAPQPEPKPQVAAAPATPVTPVTTGLGAIHEADREFAELPSASQGRQAETGKAPGVVGPKVSAGAAPESEPPIIQQPALPGALPGGCPVCGKSILHDNPECANHRAPLAPSTKPVNGKAVAQATLGVGAVGGSFRNWCAEFAKKFPAYRINPRDEQADMYHILKTVGALGIAQITSENIAEVCQRLHTHAQEAHA